MKVLVTGGAGYIGSHTCVELIAAGYEPVIFDNFYNSKPQVIERLERICGRAIKVINGDITNAGQLASAFSEHDFAAVIHFAGLKAVGESCEKPLLYYQNNVAGTLSLCETMKEHGIDRLIFSSSATVYGDPDLVPIDESAKTGATNPYGRSKLIIEQILGDFCSAPDSSWRVSLLRYFNPIGAHESGLIGEDPMGIPNNLLPYVAQVAVGKLKSLGVFGDDYSTPDGTGVRDYIHVVDLARGHVKALQHLLGQEPGCHTFNLGTGSGYSVLEVVKAFESVCGKKVPYEIKPRRPGDIAECYAKTDKAESQLGWKAGFGLKRMVEDTWRWQSGNPEGYK